MQALPIGYGDAAVEQGEKGPTLMELLFQGESQHRHNFW